MINEDIDLLRAELHDFITSEIQGVLDDGEIVTSWILVFETKGEDYKIGTISGDILGELALPVWTFTGMLEEAVEIKNGYLDEVEEDE